MADINDKLLTLIGTNSFLENLYYLYQENRKCQHSLIQAIILLHNNNQLDLISEFSKLNKSCNNNINWYSFS